MNSSSKNPNHVKVTVFRLGDFWVFDDPFFKVENEPFVSGMPAMINVALTLLTNSSNHKMFDLEISTEPSEIQPDNDIVLTKSHEEEEGCWYWWNQAILEGWLSPYFSARFTKQFGTPFPEKLYLRFTNIQDSYSIVI